MNKHLVILTTLLAILSGHVLAEDSIIHSRNPGCNLEECKHVAVSLSYVKSVIGNESMHYLWSNLGDVPGFLLIQSDNPEANVTIDWKKLVKGEEKSIGFDEPIMNAVGVVCNKFVVWNDTHGNGTITDERYDLDWTIVKFDEPVVDASAYTAEFSFKSGNMTTSLKLSTRISSMRHHTVPHLLVAPKSFHVEADIENSTNQKYAFKSPRLLLEFSVIVLHNNQSFVKTESTIDDEYSPGVFVDKTLVMGNDSQKTYVTWKPAAYANPDRIIAHTIDVKENFDEKVDEVTSKSSHVFGFFSGQTHFVHNLTLILGSTKDNYYKDYTSFNFLVGVGDPPREGLSLVVQMVILAGFGLPVIALLGSCLYVGVKRLRRPQDEPLLGNNN